MITKPKGCHDIYGMEARKWKYVEQVIDALMEKYHYNYMRTPIFESTELFHRGVGESTDIVTKETYDFVDRGERAMTLRPEGTAGIVRSYIENKMYGDATQPVKIYYNGTMYRYERPQAGRYREFIQFGVEVFNSNDVMSDAEVISLGYYFLSDLGLDITVKINSLGDAQSRVDYTNALVDYFKPHINELCSDCQKRLETNPLRIIDCKVDKDKDIIKNAPNISDYLSQESKDRFEKLKSYLNFLEINYEVDESIVRGLDYYDENVWEYVLESDSLALGGGGRYNHLVKNLGGPDMPAVGFALGIDRVILKLLDIIDVRKLDNAVDVYIMAVSEEEKIQALRLAQNLRLNNIITEINDNGLSLKSQFKAADNNHAKFLFILNDDDLQKGLINVKDNVTKEEIKISEDEIVDWIMGNI